MSKPRNIFTGQPVQPGTPKPGHLSPAQVDQFFREGFLQLDNFYDIETEMQPCRRATEVLVETDVAQRLSKAGKITETYPNEDLFHRLTKIHQDFHGASVILHKQKEPPKEYRDLWSNSRMLNVMEQLIGPVDIAGNPVWNLRPKTPQNSYHDVPWHQDSAYQDEDSVKALYITAWIPLLDTNKQNGCLQVIRGGHKAGKVASHRGCWEDTWYIWTDAKDLEDELGVNMETDIVTCEVPYGGVLLFSNLLPHRSVPNMSNDIRWSLDLRYQDAASSAGFYGIKDSIVLRQQNDPHYRPDWEAWHTADRAKKLLEISGAEATDEFDFTNVGPYMQRWPIVHHNMHTARLKNR